MLAILSVTTICQNVSSETENEANISENKVTNSILKNGILSCDLCLTTKQPKTIF